MHLAWRCPGCRRSQWAAVDAAAEPKLECSACGWSRVVPAVGDPPRQCLVCGCDDLWRQKDFPPRLGLLLVGLGAVFSTLAWLYYYPLLALGILMAFALADVALFAMMKDVLVCYRCGARHGQVGPLDERTTFDLETAERYRQERLRLEQAATRKESN